MNTLNFQNAQGNKWAALSAGLAIAAVAISAPSAEAATFSLNFDEGAGGGAVQYNTDGSLDTTQWASMGLTNITGTNNRTRSAAVLNTYNSSVYSGNDSIDRDWDLTTGSFTHNGQVIDTGTALQGNVLIIQEEDGHSFKNGRYIADDEGAGGNINFGFESAVALSRFSLLDIDDNKHNNRNRITVTGFNDDGEFTIDVDKLINEHKDINGNSQGSTFTKNGVTITQVSSKRGDNSMYQFDLDEAHFADMRFNDVRFNYPGSGAIAGIEWRTDDEGPAEIPEPSVIGGLLMLGFVGVRKRLKSNKIAVEMA